jgi:hypothetical protein
VTAQCQNNTSSASALGRPRRVTAVRATREPYRRVGTNFYDLSPIYLWSSSSAGSNSRLPPRPMAEWYGVTAHSGPVYIRYLVDQVLQDGLLVHESRFVTYTVDDPPFFLTNYPNFRNLTDNQSISFLALRTGGYRYVDTLGAVRTIPLYDYGTPVSLEALRAALYPPLTPEQQAARAAERAVADDLRERNRLALQAKALKFNQDLADQGDPGGQFRMGERYRDGDGVPKDAAKAKEYFGKSAAQGNRDAARALEALNAGTLRVNP